MEGVESMEVDDSCKNLNETSEQELENSKSTFSEQKPKGSKSYELPW